MKGSTTEQKIATIASLIGFADSVYLSVEKLANIPSLCLPGIGGCITVSNSIYSQVFGIPVAVFGAFAYLLLVVLLAANKKIGLADNYRDLAVFGISLAGFVYSIYLTYLEIAVIKAVCPFCVISAIMMSVVFICSLLRLVQNQSDLNMSLEDKNGQN